jgi:hypothetical protein
MAKFGGSGGWSTGLKLASGVQAIGNLVPDVTRKAFEKHGFPAGRLAADWSAIVGQEIARFCRPERIKWPRPVESDDEDGETSTAPAGATLVLRVEGARALDVQYRAHHIMERINGFLGYRAITEIRIVQAPVVCRLGGGVKPRPAFTKARQNVAPSTADTPLAQALDRLAQSVATAQRADAS